VENDHHPAVRLKEKVCFHKSHVKTMLITFQTDNL